jgi:hypothetical protein
MEPTNAFLSIGSGLGKEAAGLVKFSGEELDYCEWKLGFLAMARALKVSNALFVQELPSSVTAPLVNYYGDSKAVWDDERNQAFMLLLVSQGSAEGRECVVSANNDPMAALEALESHFNPQDDESRKEYKKAYTRAAMESGETAAIFLTRLIKLARRVNDGFVLP